MIPAVTPASGTARGDCRLWGRAYSGTDARGVHKLGLVEEFVHDNLRHVQRNVTSNPSYFLHASNLFHFPSDWFFDT
jgi:hypothetical protein